MPAGVGYNVVAKTSFGRVHSELEMTVSGEISNEALNAKIAGGGSELRLMDQNGDIEILMMLVMEKTPISIRLLTTPKQRATSIIIKTQVKQGLKGRYRVGSVRKNVSRTHRVSRHLGNASPMRIVVGY